MTAVVLKSGINAVHSNPIICAYKTSTRLTSGTPLYRFGVITWQVAVVMGSSSVMRTILLGALVLCVWVLAADGKS